MLRHTLTPRMKTGTYKAKTRDVQFESFHKIEVKDLPREWRGKKSTTNTDAAP